MNATEQYIADRDTQVRFNMQDKQLKRRTDRYMEYLVATNYGKNFTWMGIPIIQFPSDLMVMQEIIWKVKPDYIIETGVAFGGMITFYASILEAIGKGKALGIDIDPRKHNMDLLEVHPLRHRIDIVKGSSTDEKVIDAVKNYISPLIPKPVIMACLDSNHTKDHVLQELRLYSPLVSVGSYIVVFDTAIEFVGSPAGSRGEWGRGNSPWTAVQEFMKDNDEFVVDTEVETRALVTAAPGGWLKRIKEAKV